MGDKTLNIYFAINGDYRIDYGKDGAVLYWFKEEAQFYLEKIHAIIFSLIEEQSSYHEIQSKFGKKKTNLVISDFLNFGIIKIVEYPQGREVARHGRLYNNSKHQNLSIRSLFVSLPFGCEKDCVFCKAQTMMGCFSCIGTTSSMDYDYYNLLDFILKFAKDVKCTEIILKGGNPLLFWADTKNILSIIRSKFLGTIKLIINSEPSITQEKELRLLNINVCINIEFNDFKAKVFQNRLSNYKNYNINASKRDVEYLKDISQFLDGCSITIYSDDSILINHADIIQI